MTDWITKLQEAAAKTKLSGTPPGLQPQRANSPAVKLDKIDRFIASSPNKSSSGEF
jgi:hypothetical protein